MVLDEKLFEHNIGDVFIDDDGIERKINKLGQARKTKKMSHKEPIPVSIMAYDDLFNAGYDPYADKDNFGGYWIGKRRRENLSNAEQICKKYNIPYEIKMNNDNRYIMSMDFPDDADAVDRYERDHEKVMVMEAYHSRDDIMKDVYKNFKNITGTEFNDIFNQDDSEIPFNQDVIDNTEPSIRKHLKMKYKLGDKDIDDLYYDLDLFFLSKKSPKNESLNEDLTDIDGMLDDAYNGSYYTIVGAGGDLQEWKDGYQELLDKEGIGKISKWITFKGSDMNNKYGLTGQNAYNNDLTFLAFPLDGLDVGKLAIFKLRMQDRWFDDIVENNRRDIDESFATRKDGLKLTEAKNLTERMWKNKVPEDLAKNFRNALANDCETLGPSIDAFNAILDWMIQEYPDSTDEINDIKEDLSMFDRDASPDDSFFEDEYDEDGYTNEDNFNYVLNNFYDLCDYLELWIPTDGMYEALSTKNGRLHLKESKQGFVKRYKGYGIHDAGDTFVVTDEHGTTIGQERTEVGAEGLIDSLIDKKTVNEDLETQPNVGLASVINALIQDEWQAIQGYKDAIVAFESEGNSENAKVLNDILNEENVHVGQLQTLLKTVDVSAEQIEAGEAEANTQLADTNSAVDISSIAVEINNTTI